MEQLYVLQLEDGKYYVGKTKDIRRRVEEHARGDGPEWTRTYRPVKVLEVRPLKNEHDENNTTKDVMKKYGEENVRGGAYCQMELPGSYKAALQAERRSTQDACFKCGGRGHFAAQCRSADEEEEVCGRCGRNSHPTEDCYASTHFRGHSISSDDEDSDTDTEEDSESDAEDSDDNTEDDSDDDFD
jgi:predicted GIY-YIG superfamily endonuclease